MKISGFEEISTLVKIPSLIHSFPCGAGSPIDDSSIEFFEVPTEFVKNIENPYIIEARGDSMSPFINNGDLLIVDNSKEAAHEDTVVARLNGDFLVKILKRQNGKLWLQPANDMNYKSIEIKQEDDFLVIGVVKWIISKPTSENFE